MRNNRNILYYIPEIYYIPERVKLRLIGSNPLNLKESFCLPSIFLGKILMFSTQPQNENGTQALFQLQSKMRFLDYPGVLEIPSNETLYSRFGKKTTQCLITPGNFLIKLLNEVFVNAPKNLTAALVAKKQVNINIFRR